MQIDGEENEIKKISNRIKEQYSQYQSLNDLKYFKKKFEKFLEEKNVRLLLEETKYI